MEIVPVSTKNVLTESSQKKVLIYNSCYVLASNKFWAMESLKELSEDVFFRSFKTFFVRLQRWQNDC